MDPIVECVPNISEGRNPAVIKEVTDAIEAVSGVRLLDVDPGDKTNRTVITFVGAPEAVMEGAFQTVKRASEVIDMAGHHGEHPRMGATDVVPFVPVAGVTMEECAEMARKVGKRIGSELGIPVYLYEQAASRPERQNLSKVRSGEYEGLEDKLQDPEWAPDFGPAEFNPRTGVTGVGAREFLIAYNINLNSTDRRYANEIAYELRERGRWKRTGNTDPFYYKGDPVDFAEDGTYPCGNCELVASSFEELETHYSQDHGGELRARYEDLEIDPENPQGHVFKDGKFKNVKAIGWVIDEYNRAQISMNLTDYKVTPAHEVLDAAREEARKRGILLTGSEVVGLIPFDAVKESGRYYRQKMMKSTGMPIPDLVETAVQSMGFRDVAPFDAKEKVLGLPVSDGELVNMATFDFVDEVSRDTAAPGGGSVAALAGAMGAALGAMVANLSIGKGEFDDRYHLLCSIAERGQVLKDALVRGVDEDTQAFDLVMVGLRMPKDTPAEKATRSAAIQEGYKTATLVPLTSVEQCRDVLALCKEMVVMAPEEMLSDVGAGALVARAGFMGAAYNVRINLKSIKDAAWALEIRGKVEGLVAEGETLAKDVEAFMEEALEGEAS
jgi:glutamate formiminotransferase/formiminotetrahydrofolate cyclodeaminase